jgi:hypothetical protein
MAVPVIVGRETRQFHDELMDSKDSGRGAVVSVREVVEGYAGLNMEEGKAMEARREPLIEMMDVTSDNKGDGKDWQNSHCIKLISFFFDRRYISVQASTFVVLRHIHNNHPRRTRSNRTSDIPSIPTARHNPYSEDMFEPNLIMPLRKIHSSKQEITIPTPPTRYMASPIKTPFHRNMGRRRTSRCRPD